MKRQRLAIKWVKEMSASIDGERGDSVQGATAATAAILAATTLASGNLE